MHIAYYRSSTGDLCYAYLSKYDSKSSSLATVDSYLSVGQYLRIGTLYDGTNYVPSISYYSGTFASTSASVKLAYRADFSSLRDGETNDQFTGAWEVQTLPCSNTPKAYNIGLGYKDFGSGTRSSVLGYVTDTTLEYAHRK